MGFLNHVPAKFSFIGPDRAPVEVTSVDQCLKITDTNCSTGLPNNVQAKIPLKYGQNME